MLTLLSQHIENKLSTLPYFDVWGGVVKPFERKRDDGTTQTVPLSCGQDYNDCLTDPYRLITADDSKLSVMYLEAADEVTLSNDGLGVGRIETSFDLIVWLNLPKLGYEDYCSAQAFFSMQFQKLLNFKHKVRAENIDISYAVTSDRTDTDNPFEKYDYDALRLILRPYTYIVLRMSAIGRIGLSCLDNYEPGAEIECYDEETT